MRSKRLEIVGLTAGLLIGSSFFGFGKVEIDDGNKWLAKSAAPYTGIIHPFPVFTPVVKASSADVRCLADNIYHEARNQTDKGQLGVAFVTIKRSTDPSFPPTICKVVHSKAAFSWTLKDKEKPKVKPSVGAKAVEQQALLKAHIIAREALSNPALNPVGNAEFYHHKSVKPKWAKQMQVAAVIGPHIFYNSPAKKK
jgi:spore germination cell wall hydrolase CwlJ-like protein